MEVQDLLEYVNSELANGSNLTKFAKGLGKNESTIRKKLNKAGYKRVGNKFVLNVDTTRSTTRYEENKLGHMPHNNIYSMKAASGNMIHEGMKCNDEEKELIRLKYLGKITEEEFIKRVLDLAMK